MQPMGPSLRSQASEGDQAAIQPALNELALTAELTERGIPRYNLSGLPVTEGVLTHASRRPEAGVEREVHLQIQAIAMGDVASRLGSIAPGTQVSVRGFLTQARRSTRLICLHLTHIDPY